MSPGDSDVKKTVKIKVDGAIKGALEISRQRIIITGCIVSLAFFALGGRIVSLAIAGVDSVARAAYSHNGEITFSRADIMDTKGVLLATNLNTASLYANPKKVQDAEKAAKSLIKIFPELSYKSLLKKFSSEKGFAWVKRNLMPKEQYAVNNLGIPGLFFEKEEKRVYPHDGLFAHVLGFVDVDGNGVSGIEKTFDRDLRTELDKDNPLELSVDVRVQGILHDELTKSMKEFKAKGAAGVVMDVNSGEIVAMSSLPDYNPNISRKSKNKAKDNNAIFNRATLGIYEMGSTFKVFTMAMALDEGVISLNDIYDITDPIRIARFMIRDHHPLKRKATVPEIFMHSSNIGAAKIAVEVGAAKQQEFMNKLRLLESSPVELPETATPLYPDRWGEISTMTISYGHGIAVSPIHVAAAMSAIVNGGTYYEPTLVKNYAAKGERIIKPETSEKMRRLLRLVVGKGTGKQAKADGYLVGGKTGTAEKPTSKGYDRKAHITSFAGAFPMHDPKYVVFVMMDEPKGTKKTWGWATAGWNAAPTAGNVISRIGPLLGINPVDEESPEIQKIMHIDYEMKGKEVAGF